MQTNTIVLREPKKISIEKLETAELKPGFAEVKMLYCGICGSDIGAYLGTNPTMRYPIIGLGHEGVGIIEKIESGHDLTVGDRVVLEPYIPCGECYICKEGGNNCTHLKVTGVHCPGMMTEHFQHPISLIHKIPDIISWEQAVMTEPLTIALHGVQRAQVAKGDVCVITGGGPIGVLAACVVKAYGATPIILDHHDNRLQFAKNCGIDYTFNNSDGDGFVEYIQQITDGKLADCMVDCTGSANILLNMHDYVRNGGRIALVGWPREPLMVNTVRWMQKELNIFPSRNSHNNFPEALDLISNDKVPVKQFLTKIIEIEQFQDTVEDMIINRKNYIKVAIRLNKPLD